MTLIKSVQADYEIRNSLLIPGLNDIMINIKLKMIKAGTLFQVKKVQILVLMLQMNLKWSIDIWKKLDWKTKIKQIKIFVDSIDLYRFKIRFKRFSLLQLIQ